jgi:hypothetical protein
VPFMESTGGHSRLTMASRNPSSRLYTAHVELFPSSRSTAGASGGPRPRVGPEGGGSPAARVSRRVGIPASPHVLRQRHTSRAVERRSLPGHLIALIYRPRPALSFLSVFTVPSV